MTIKVNTLFSAIALLAGLLGASPVAHALPISLTPSSPSVASGSDTSQAAINGKISAWVGQLDILYKAVQGGSPSEEGSFMGSYSTQYGIPLPKASATITYDGAPDPYINTNPVYLLIKGGNVNLPLLEWYLFDISGWNGMETIQLSNFYGGNQGKISHISIYGGESTTNVPDGGSTAVLLGVSLLGLSFVARRRA